MIVTYVTLIHSVRLFFSGGWHDTQAFAKKKIVLSQDASNI